MRFTRVLFLTKSIRDELIEMRTKQNKSKSISEYLLWLYKEKNFSLLHLIKNFNENRRLEAINNVNKYYEHDYNRLGPDLHAATYTLKLGGRCRIYGSPRWISASNKNLDEILPNQRINNFHIEGLDLSNTVINSEGISNIENCSNLKTLILKNCALNDDWLLSRLSGVFSDTLEYLDISNCDNVTYRGLIILGHLKKLKRLNLANLNGVKNIEYVSILLEENSENDLLIEGVDHLSEENMKLVECFLNEEDTNLKKALESNDKKNFK